MSTTTPQTVSTVLAREPCAGCGAPLGSDQRYCLSCGVPRVSTRLPFLDVLTAEASNAAAGGLHSVAGGLHSATYLRAPAMGQPGAGLGWGQGDGTGAPLARHTGPLALASSLLLALIVGLLVGHWVSGAPSKSAGTLTQVIRYEGLPAAAVAQPAAPAAAAGSAAGTSVPTTPAASTPTTPATPASGATSTSTNTTAASHATNPTLQSLQSTTGKQHAQQVNKLIDKGKPISTGGAPPPKDNKPAGNGSGFQTIG